MANQRDIDRWKKGKDHWNEWAEGHLRARKALEDEGKWALDHTGGGANAETKRWTDSASVDFSENVFEETAGFPDFLFPWTANFYKATFKKGVWFKGVTFPGKVHFEGATFNGNTFFGDATFKGEAAFNGATFKSEARFERAAFQGRAQFNAVAFNGDGFFNWATFEQDAHFSGVTFEQDAEFDEATFKKGVLFNAKAFSGPASFCGATFKGVASFSGKTFSNSARFERATFEEVSFERATFKAHALFDWVTFSEASFREATFSNVAMFSKCTFDENTNFDHAVFEAGASFNSSKSNGPFSLADARFDRVPDFTGAQLGRVLRLDNVRVPEPASCDKGSKESAARFRVLKGLAIQAHDYERELDFFAGELKSRRFVNDHPFGRGWPKFWAGKLYEFLSNFGRSLMRPLIALAALFIGFTFVYVLTRDLVACQKCGLDGLLPMSKATYLSFVNSMPFIGLGKNEQIKQISNCLYGTEILPLGITVGTTVQTILSTILIFLFILALRNHFKIK